MTVKKQRQTSDAEKKELANLKRSLARRFNDALRERPKRGRRK